MPDDILDWQRVIHRVEMPPAGDDYDGTLYGLYGGQHDWVWAVGLPYRALAAPHGGAAMPASPLVLVHTNEYGFEVGNFKHGLGYFASLQSFLCYSFGWTRHDRGLLWWYDSGEPTDDPRFALLRAVWERDGMLLRYLDWAIAHGFESGFGDEWAHGPLSPWREIDRTPVDLTREWEIRLKRVREEADAQDLSTNPWGMHLEGGFHIGAPSRRKAADSGYSGYGGGEPSGSTRLLGVDARARRATFVSDTVTGWYADLAARGEELPDLPGGRSWRVDVFVKPIGFLGVYRRSRETGLWFSGRHRHHVVGN